MISEQKSATNLHLSQNYAFDNQLALTFVCDPEEILDVFALTASQLEFELIEKEASYATAVKKIKQSKSLLSFMNCCSWWESDQFTAVKIQLAKQSRKGQMDSQLVAQVKGLVGLQAQIKPFLKVFKQKIQKLENNSSFNKLILAEPEELMTISTQNENPYYLQACSHQIVNKLLLTQSYGIGQQLHKMISDFRQNFRNIGESASLLPLPVKNIMSIINDIDQQLTQLLLELNYPRQILVFSRIQLQSYVFNKLQDQLYAMYRFKNVLVEQKFQQKKIQIIQTYTIKEMLVEVCLNKKFWSIKQEVQQSLLPFKQAKQAISFAVGCRELEKMVFTNSPREKIKYCQLAYTVLKNHFYDFSKKKQNQHQWKTSSPSSLQWCFSWKLPS